MSPPTPDYAEQALYVDPFIDVMGLLMTTGASFSDNTGGLFTLLSEAIADASEVALNNNCPAEVILSAKFALCAWCDEYIMNAGWPGVSSDWPNLLLQKKFFDTDLAGSEFFERLEILRKDNGMAQIFYAFCLANGFKGRYVYDLAIEEWSTIRDDSLERALHLTSLDRRDSEVFPSLRELASSHYRMWHSKAWITKVAGLLIGFAILSFTLSLVLHHEIMMLLKSWK